MIYLVFFVPEIDCVSLFHIAVIGNRFIKAIYHSSQWIMLIIPLPRGLSSLRFASGRTTPLSRGIMSIIHCLS